VQREVAGDLQQDVADEEDPAAKPNCAAVKPKSLVNPLGPANEIAVRSRKLMKNISATNGTSRSDTFRMADFSMAGAAEISTLSPEELRTPCSGRRGQLLLGDMSWYDE